MRQLASLFLFSLLLGCVATRIAKPGSTALNGTWVPVSQEFGGKQLPPILFEKQKLVLLDSNYTFTAESIDKGVLDYSDGKMDIYGRQGVNTGKHFMAIYKMENGQLTICYNLLGNRYPVAYATKGKPNFFISVYKKG